MAVSQDQLNILVELQDKASAQLKSIVTSLSDVQKQSNTGAKAVSDLGKASAEAAKSADALGKGHAGVNRELLVLAHELSQGNFTKFGGSLLVLGERSNALGKAFQLLAVGGGAVGLAIAAVAGTAVLLGTALVQANLALKEFNANAVLTNNYTALTASGFKNLANAVENETGRSFSTATEAILLLQRSALFTGSQLKVAASDVIKFAQLTGSSIEDATKVFEKLAESPSKFIAASRSAQTLFSPGQQQVIRDLEATGHAQEAVTLALDVYKRKLDSPEARQALEDQLSWIQKIGIGWAYAGEQLSKYLGITSKPLTAFDKKGNLVDSQLKDINDKIAEARKAANDSPNNAFATQQLNDFLKQRTAIVKQVQDADFKASADGSKALYGTLSAEADSFFKAQGVKTAKTLSNALAALDAARQKQQAVFNYDGTKGDLLDQKTYDQTRAKIIKENTNPIDDHAAKEQYQVAQERQNRLIQLAKDYYDIRNEYAKVALDKGEISEDEYAKKVHDNRVNDLGDQIFYTNAKIALAQKEAARTHNADGLKDIEKYTDQVAHLHQLELLENAKYEGDLAKHAEAIAKINQKTVDEVTKTANARDTAIQREFNKATLSGNEAALADAQNNVIDRFAAFKDRLSAELKAQHASADQIAESLATLDKAQAVSLAKETDYSNQRIALQHDVSVGFIKTYKDIQEAAANSAQHASDFLKSITGGFESFLTTFAETGKLSFKSLEQSITSSISKIVAQILVAKAEKALLEGSSGSALSTAGSFFGALFGSGKAVGGPVNANTIYPVGEKGPELFMPSSAGTIIPNSALGGNVTNHFATTIMANDSQSFLSQAKRVERDLVKMHLDASRKYNIRATS